MTDKIIVICWIVCFLAMSGCRSSMDNTDKQEDDEIYMYEMSDCDSMNTSEDDIIQTYEKSDKNGRLRTYYELADGSWKAGNYYYEERVILSGRYQCKPVINSDCPFRGMQCGRYFLSRDKPKLWGKAHYETKGRGVY